MLAVVFSTGGFTSTWYVGITRRPLKSSRKSRHSWPVRTDAMGAKGGGKGWRTSGRMGEVDVRGCPTVLLSLVDVLQQKLSKSSPCHVQGHHLLVIPVAQLVFCLLRFLCSHGERFTWDHAFLHSFNKQELGTLVLYIFYNLPLWVQASLCFSKHLCVRVRVCRACVWHTFKIGMC